MIYNINIYVYVNIYIGINYISIESMSKIYENMNVCVLHKYKEKLEEE